MLSIKVLCINFYFREDLNWLHETTNSLCNFESQTWIYYIDLKKKSCMLVGCDVNLYLILANQIIWKTIIQSFPNEIKERCCESCQQDVAKKLCRVPHCCWRWFGMMTCESRHCCCWSWHSSHWTIMLHYFGSLAALVSQSSWWLSGLTGVRYHMWWWPLLSSGRGSTTATHNGHTATDQSWERKEWECCCCWLSLVVADTTILCVTPLTATLKIKSIT